MSLTKLNGLITTSPIGQIIWLAQRSSGKLNQDQLNWSDHPVRLIAILKLWRIQEVCWSSPVYLGISIMSDSIGKNSQPTQLSSLVKNSSTGSSIQSSVVWLCADQLVKLSAQVNQVAYTRHSYLVKFSSPAWLVFISGWAQLGSLTMKSATEYINSPSPWVD